jgi:hypothetical protein
MLSLKKSQRKSNLNRNNLVYQLLLKLLSQKKRNHNNLKKSLNQFHKSSLKSLINQLNKRLRNMSKIRKPRKLLSRKNPRKLRNNKLQRNLIKIRKPRNLSKKNPRKLKNKKLQRNQIKKISRRLKSTLPNLKLPSLKLGKNQDKLLFNNLLNNLGSSNLFKLAKLRKLLIILENMLNLAKNKFQSRELQQ